MLLAKFTGGGPMSLASHTSHGDRSFRSSQVRSRPNKSVEHKEDQ